MKKTIVLYDDNRIPDREILNITGNKGFGETIYKRVPLRERMAQTVSRTSVCGALVTSLSAPECREQPILKIYSYMAVRDAEAFSVLARKALYANECYQIVQNGVIAGVIAPSAEALASCDNEETLPAVATDAFYDLSAVPNFRQFITGGFDSRFFNELNGDAYTVVKTSANKEKLRKEYEFYELLPDEMKMWFVKPFSYRETEREASYTMERFHTTDLAIRYVHGAISEEEFRGILDKLFRFLSTRKEKEVSAQEYQSAAEALYVTKVRERQRSLASCEAYERINPIVPIAPAFDRYYDLYAKITAGRAFRPVLVIGHGDLCFSNILYSKEVSLMRLIDPKGASNAEEMYLNPYYDLAKLSHSICGGYDYFNSGLFEITLDETLRARLSIDCDNSRYIAIFREYLLRFELDPALVRLYEASLFLSMLPLHVDREKKVLGFLLNAIRIMDELEGKS